MCGPGKACAAGPGPGLALGRTGSGTAQRYQPENGAGLPGRSALMASPDGLGWPEEPAGFSLRAARDESRFMTAGLGWPRRGPGTRQPAPAARTVVAGSGQDTARPARGVSRTGEDGQGQVFRDGAPGEPPARVKQALSAAVSRETDARNVSARDEAQGSGTVRTRGKPAGGGAPWSRKRPADRAAAQSAHARWCPLQRNRMRRPRRRPVPAHRGISFQRRPGPMSGKAFPPRWTYPPRHRCRQWLLPGRLHRAR